MKREPMQLVNGYNILRIKIGEQNYDANIVVCLDGYFLKFRLAYSKKTLFDFAGIKDQYKFQREILGYSDGIGDFPCCHSYGDVIILTKAIVDYNNAQLQIKSNFFLRNRKKIKFNFNL